MLILDELWYEHMNLEEHTKGDKEYFRELKTLADLGEKFVPMLTAECKELYEQISGRKRCFHLRCKARCKNDD